MKSTDLSKARAIVNKIIDTEQTIFKINEYYKPNQMWWLMHDEKSVIIDAELSAEIMQLVKTRLDERKQNYIDELEKIGVDYVDEKTKTTTEN